MSTRREPLGAAVRGIAKVMTRFEWLQADWVMVDG